MLWIDLPSRMSAVEQHFMSTHLGWLNPPPPAHSSLALAEFWSHFSRMPAFILECHSFEDWTRLAKSELDLYTGLREHYCWAQPRTTNQPSWCILESLDMLMLYFISSVNLLMSLTGWVDNSFVAKKLKATGSQLLWKFNVQIYSIMAKKDFWMRMRGVKKKAEWDYTYR